MVFWAATGFLIAPVLPTLLAWATGLFPERAGFAAGMVLSLGVLGGIFSPLLIGLVAEAFSLGNGILLLAFSALMIAIVISFVRKTAIAKNGIPL
jgi:fucose permease